MHESEEEEEFSFSDLNENVPLDAALARPPKAEPVDKTPAQRVAEADAGRHEEKERQERQNTLWRRMLFYGVSAIVVALAGMNLVFIVWYMKQPDPSAAVLSTWLGGGVVQVVGLLLVITRHLFPGEHDSK